MKHAIWAMDANWLIGKDNVLPWHIKEDLAYFKAMTNNQTVLMGDATYRSLKSYYKDKRLPYGKMFVANLVPTSYDDATCITNVVEFVKTFNEELWVIGGKMIYQLTLPYMDYLHITHVLGTYEGNVYFTPFELSSYKLLTKEVKPGLIFATYKK